MRGNSVVRLQLAPGVRLLREDAPHLISSTAKIELDERVADLCWRVLSGIPVEAFLADIEPLNELVRHGLFQSPYWIRLREGGLADGDATLLGADHFSRTLKYYRDTGYWLAFGIATRNGILPEYTSFCHRFPRELRQVSLDYVTRGENRLYSLRAQRGVTAERLIDIGTLDDEAGPESLTDRIKGVISCLSAFQPRYIVLGGDHSATAMIVPLLGQVHVVVFDAHLDLHPPRHHHIVRHDETLARLLATEAVRSITVAGPRGLYRSSFSPFEPGRLQVVSIESLGDTLARLDRNVDVYLSIDFDVFDPAFLPGVTSPEPFGWSYGDYRNAIAQVVESIDLSRFRAIDFVENSPATDGGSDLQKSLRIIVDTLAMLSAM